MNAQVKIFTNLELLDKAKCKDSDIDGSEGYVRFEVLGQSYNADFSFDDDYSYSVTQLQNDNEEAVTDAQLVFVAECIVEQMLDAHEEQMADEAAKDAYDDYLHSRAVSQYERSTGNLPAWA